MVKAMGGGEGDGRRRWAAAKTRKWLRFSLRKQTFRWEKTGRFIEGFKYMRAVHTISETKSDV